MHSVCSKKLQKVTQNVFRSITFGGFCIPYFQTLVTRQKKMRDFLEKMRRKNLMNRSVVQNLYSVDQQTFLQLVRVLVPQFLVMMLLVVYVFSGSVIFVLLDDKIANETFTEVVLFSFTTLTTIGLCLFAKKPKIFFHSLKKFPDFINFSLVYFTFLYYCNSYLFIYLLFFFWFRIFW